MNAKIGTHGAKDAAVAAKRPSRQINVVLRNTESSGSYSVLEGTNGYRSLPQSGPWLEWQKELDRLIGLDNVKELVYEIYALLQVAHYRGEAGLLAPSQVYHMVFKGNPGTG